MNKSIRKLGALLTLLGVCFGTAQAESVTYSAVTYGTLTINEANPTAFGITSDGSLVASDDESAVITVTSSSSSYRGDSHSILNNPTVTFKTSTAFTLTLGGCQYDNADAWTVTVDGETVGTINTKTTGCYHNTGDTVTFTYNTYPTEEVEVVVAGGQYLPYISLTLIDPIQEKCLYYSDFTDWCDYETSASTSETNVTWTTKYSHENLTFSIYDSQITCTNSNTGKFPNWEGGFIIAAKSSDPYIITSALSSITTVTYEIGATGSNRGWSIYAKGDGDDDWVLISDAVASTAQGTTYTVDINRTNCQLKMLNINSSQNAYLMYIEINGNVDISTTPSIESFVVNGTTVETGEIFEENSDGDMAATIEISKTTEAISESNPLTDIVVGNGTVGDITYSTEGENYDAVTTVTIPVSTSTSSLNYVVTVVFKPDYTVTFVNTDGATLATQIVEKDAEIGEFAVDESLVTVADGYAMRGWFVSDSGDSNRKYTTSEVITDDVNFYAVATEIETMSTTKTYIHTLTNKYFYAEDHEGFNSVGSGYYHDGTHGWAFSAGDTLKVLVGGDAYLIFYLCKYSSSSSSLEILNSNNESVGSLTSAYVSTDGDMQSFYYQGDADTLKIVFNATTYIHKLMVANTADAPIEPNEAGWYVVSAGDASHFLSTLTIATAASSSDSRTYIFLPNGTYDLGETVLTTVAGSNISIIGESMDSTIILNAPDISVEGIGTTATLYNSSSNLYLQDLTLQNDLDYYSSGSAGRAVCLQDKGTNTICKNVKMVSYQDTYYSNKATQFYWETSELQGTVDFLCGDGDVIYNQCDIVVRPRTSSGSGECTIAAPYQTSGTCDWGYVFLDCNIINEAASFNLGRAWGGAAKLAYINTVFTGTSSKEIISSRFTTAGMNVAATAFYEYNSVDEDGTVVSPSTNYLTFTHSSGNNSMETILTDDAAADYTVDNIFGSWAPDSLAAQVTAPEVTIADGVATWTASDDAIAYLVYVDGVLEDLVPATTTSYAVSATTESVELRAANSMGGFGLRASDIIEEDEEDEETEGDIEEGDEEENALEDIFANDKEVASVSIYNIAGQKLSSTERGLNIVSIVYTDGSHETKKILVK